MPLARLVLAIALLLPAGAARAQETIDCGYPLSQMELTYCAEKAWEAADADLNAAYREAMARMREMDANLADMPDLQGAAEALKEAQRAWIPYRDKACAAYGFLARGGTMEPQLIYGCLATLTVRRAEELKDLAAGIEGR
ncbi:lysozyme inhibitor LprI family protein [Polymorphum gilvum]|uniref:Probable urease-associated protein n=1 Tax=Polymorphum gilvum (strain LMG 25793 / CGMCC 1.9160 / SL003B-26A1) TaxID=991905 RepID=F2IZC0_POLGS|nr:lysozyme inhibitor LprI family protein [Polymorphum gilvum]ADZ68543.1 Probable urease-associated protein [Polymorphum gilvum SL003B-26A1]